jgi:glycerophosphoryl diester phosphodiesterase
MRTKYWCFSLSMIMACATSSNINSTPKPLPVFDMEGHRGCRGLMPENTIPAMLKALELGVTTLEMDAAITTDGRVILSHEPFFNHEISTAPDGQPVSADKEKGFNIFQMTYAQTQQFDVGKRKPARFPQQVSLPATKPLLADVIDNAEAYSKLKGRELPFYNIETKTDPATDGLFHPVPETFVEVLMAVIEKKNIKGRVIIQSFDFRTLKIIHEKYPGVRTAALVEGEDRRGVQAQLDELGFVPDIYSPFFGMVNEALVAECHAKNMRVLPWTVNDPLIIDRLKKMGVDGIISDYPNLFSKNP